MSRRSLLLLPTVLAAVALPAGPALAGEDGGDSGPATLNATQGCVSGAHAKASVSGQNITSVTYFVDGKRLKKVTKADANGRYTVTITCSHLKVGGHTARAVVAFDSGSSQTLRFQITRSARGTARFAG